MLHFHNEHTNLVATSQDVTYGNHFDDFTIVADHIRFLISMICVITQNFQECCMPIMGTTNGILHARMVVDDEVLIVFILGTQGCERLIKLFHFVGSTTGTFLHLIYKVFGEIARRKVVAYVLYKSICYIVCHGVLYIMEYGQKAHIRFSIIE